MTTGKIDGTKLLIFADGEPIGVTTAPLSIPDNYVSVLSGESFEGTFRFESPFDLMNNPRYVENYVWRQILKLPRKKKKMVKRLLEKGYTMNVTFR